MSAATSTISAVGQQNATSGSESGDTDAWKTTTSPRITFLSFFILFGMIGNTCMVITICHSRRFRTTAFYIFIINLSVVNMCECLLNMTVLMSTSVSNVWSHGDLPCRLNAFFIHFICIETILSLTILTTDRMVAVKFREKYDHVISLARFSLLISFSWVQALAFSLPIAIGVVHVSVSDYINYCTIAKRSSVVYCAFLTFLCYIIPLVICICFFIFIIRTWYKDRFAVRALLAKNNYDENANEEPRIRREILYSNLSATVCLSWLVLEAPYVITTITKLFQNSAELENVTSDTLQYAWHVDLVLLFLKFSYVLVLPIAAFAWLKELRKELKDIVLCRKNNAVLDASVKKTTVEVQRLKSVREEEKRKETSAQQKEQRVFQVPILFATSNGVHIKTAVKSKIDESDNGNENAEIVGMKCDVAGHIDTLNALGDDTSDYDSGNEMDPFSVSHPVSVKQLNNSSSLTDKHRSNSQPEVRGRPYKQKMSNNTVGSTSAGDSGLDLSTGYNSMSRPCAENNKDHSVPSVIESSTEAASNNSAQYDANSEATIKVAETSRIEKDHDDNDMFRSPSKETMISKIGDIIDTEIKPDNILKTETSKDEVYNTCDINTNLNSSVEQPLKQRTDVKGGNLPRRKKKKRREKLDDTSSVTSDNQACSTKLPLRPPPRLAPIGANVSMLSSQYTGLARPDSSCSYQSSLHENDPVCVQSHHSLRDPNISSHSSLPQSANTLDNHSNVINKWPTFSSNFYSDAAPSSKSSVALKSDSGNTNKMTLDCKMSFSCVLSEVLTPSDCHMTECLPVKGEVSKRTNSGSDNPDCVLHKSDDQLENQKDSRISQEAVEETPAASLKKDHAILLNQR